MDAVFRITMGVLKGFELSTRPKPAELSESVKLVLGTRI